MMMVSKQLVLSNCVLKTMKKEINKLTNKVKSNQVKSRWDSKFKSLGIHNTMPLLTLALVTTTY